MAAVCALGVRTPRDIHKTISTAFFLYVTVLPTIVALGMLNDRNTRDKIGERASELIHANGGATRRERSPQWRC